MLGQLHHCLATSQTYDPVKALPHATTPAIEHAAAAAALQASDIGGLKRSVVLWVKEATR
jgi:hypothetical protein